MTSMKNEMNVSEYEVDTPDVFTEDGSTIGDEQHVVQEAQLNELEQTFRDIDINGTCVNDVEQIDNDLKRFEYAATSLNKLSRDMRQLQETISVTLDEVFTVPVAPPTPAAMEDECQSVFSEAQEDDDDMDYDSDTSHGYESDGELGYDTTVYKSIDALEYNEVNRLGPDYRIKIETPTEPLIEVAWSVGTLSRRNAVKLRSQRDEDLPL